MNRREFALTAIGAALLAPPLTLARPAFASAREIKVYKTPTCSCCGAWIEHLGKAGFSASVTELEQEALTALKTQSGLTPELSSCHTGFIEGYFIEGHVPASDVQRLLAERPTALGLTVPGMPIGSPGMEVGDQKDPYDTLLVLRGGGTEVFQHHG